MAKKAEKRYILKHRTIAHFFPAWPMSYQVMIRYRGNPDVIIREAS